MLLLAAFTSLQSQPCDCVSTGNCPVPITDNGSFHGTLDVTVNGPNDLGVSPLTSVCFSITHTWIGDLSVSLTSPNGTSYLLMADANNNFGGCDVMHDNIEICIVPGTDNPLTNNANYQCNPGPCSSGICCLNGNWTVACGGVTDPINGALQAPNCNLDDFNTPGAPANGTWKLTVNDVCNQDTGVLDNFSLQFEGGTQSCIVCEADGGDLETYELTFCPGDSVSLPPLIPIYPEDETPDSSAYAYAYVISSEGLIQQVAETTDLAGLAPGTYEICGLSYLAADSTGLTALVGMETAAAREQLTAATAVICGDFSDNCASVTLLPAIPPAVIDTTLCQGQCISVGGQAVCYSDTLLLSTTNGCDSLVYVHLTLLPPDTTYVEATVCAGDCLAIGGQNFCTAGTHFIQLNNSMGCDSIIQLNLMELDPLAVIQAQGSIAVTCTHTSVTLNAGMSSPAGSVVSWSGPGGFQSEQNVIETGTPGIYTLSITASVGNLTCTDTDSVTVTDSVAVPELQLANELIPICKGDSFDLASLVLDSNGSTSYDFSFHTGTPASAANLLASSVVVPAETTTYFILATIGSCATEASAAIQVITPPTVAISVESPVCAGDPAAVSYEGSAAASANFIWNFDGASIGSGGNVPQYVIWDNPGVHEVSLTVFENGCYSEKSVTFATVETPLPLPSITCSPTTSSVKFEWNNVPGATGYNVALTWGSNGMYFSDINTFFSTGLNPGDSIAITVEAISGNICDNSVATIGCSALPCPAASVDIAPVSPICRSYAPDPILLAGTITGGSGVGVTSWTGSGITDTHGGKFEPMAAAPGDNVITFTYAEDNCTYTDQIVIQVNDMPTADFSVASPICEGSSTPVVYTGVAQSNASFEWDFDNAAVSPAPPADTQFVSWGEPGMKSLTLTVSQGNCPSASSTQYVNVESPLETPEIDCEATTAAVTFLWTEVAGASDYGIEVVSGPDGIFIDSTSYYVENLSPQQEVTISLCVHGSSVCPATTVSFTCQALPCPQVDLTIDPLPPLCAGLDTLLLNLGERLHGIGTTDVGWWSGNGIVNNTAGIFDPKVAGVGQHAITFSLQEVNCVHSTQTLIIVHPSPVADAGADFTFTCEDLPYVQLGGSSTSAGPDFKYQWTAQGKDFPGDDDTADPVVEAPGLYTLKVVNSATGCYSSDQVLISDARVVPIPSVDIAPPACRGDMNATVAVTSVSEGQPPFLFSLNSAPFSTEDWFDKLSAGLYELIVLDADGCEGSFEFEIEAPDSLTVLLAALGTGNIAQVRAGQAVQLEVQVNLPLDSLDYVQWSHPDLLSCTDCLDPLATFLENTTIKVVVGAHGCEAVASLNIYVDKNNPLYAPNAFSPNGDGVNDEFTLYGGPAVAHINSLLVFDRWGEKVFEAFDLVPGQADRTGWDGTFRGQELGEAVFVWMAEIELKDGSSSILSGDVTLLR
ncbi:MAG: hypothetical protein RI973_218 [Bacteroidota bacterium]|jgi:gliding motility-associated-like protein